MGKDTELFKAAKTGNNSVLERAFAPYLKKQGQSHGFGSSLSRYGLLVCVCVCVMETILLLLKQCKYLCM